MQQIFITNVCKYINPGGCTQTLDDDWECGRTAFPSLDSPRIAL